MQCPYKDKDIYSVKKRTANHKIKHFGSWVESEVRFLRIFAFAFHAYFRLGKVN